MKFLPTLTSRTILQPICKELTCSPLFEGYLPVSREALDLQVDSLAIQLLPPPPTGIQTENLGLAIRRDTITPNRL